jgi:hypothetical protein
MPIIRRTNCIITASGIVTLCKRLYSMPDESRLLGFLKGDKNPQHAFLRKGSKIIGPMSQICGM